MKSAATLPAPEPLARCARQPRPDDQIAGELLADALYVLTRIPRFVTADGRHDSQSIAKRIAAHLNE
jgi:hypothetical protein